jgi:hypothetical protein
MRRNILFSILISLVLPWSVYAATQAGKVSKDSARTEARSAAKTSAKVDYDCKDFSTQKEAQDFYIKNGGPTKDPHRLDRDKDGMACEDLK